MNKAEALVKIIQGAQVEEVWNLRSNISYYIGTQKLNGNTFKALRGLLVEERREYTSGGALHRVVYKKDVGTVLDRPMVTELLKAGWVLFVDLAESKPHYSIAGHTVEGVVFNKLLPRLHRSSTIDHNGVAVAYEYIWADNAVTASPAQSEADAEQKTLDEYDAHMADEEEEVALTFVEGDAADILEDVLRLLMDYGWVDGGMHKAWVIRKAIIRIIGEEQFNEHNLGEIYEEGATP